MTATRRPAGYPSDMTRKLYTGRHVDVSFDREVCTHAAECVRGLPEVFDTKKRPWIEPDAAWSPEAQDLLIEVVGRCPSGALHIERPVQQPRVEDESVTVTDNAAASRYEVHLDGDLAGFAVYALADGLITFTHTEIDPAFEGRGAGSALVRAALDDVRAKAERKVLPLCPFVKGWILRHPDYKDVLYR